TNILANVTAKNVIAHGAAQLFGDGAALFDSEIRDAASGVELAGIEDGSGGTGVNAAGAGAATIGSGEIWLQFCRTENHAEKKPRAKLLIDDASVFPDPADAGVFGVHALDVRAGINVTAADQVSGCGSVQFSFHLMQLAPHQLVIILLAPGVARNPAAVLGSAIGRIRLRGVVIERAHNHRTRPRSRIAR